MLLFRYSSRGGVAEAGCCPEVEGGLLCQRSFKVTIHLCDSSAVASVHSFPAQSSLQIISHGSFWLSQASVLKHQPRSRHFCGAGFPWQREPRWNSSASLWWLTFTALPHPLGKSVFYQCLGTTGFAHVLMYLPIHPSLPSSHKFY